MTATVDNRYPSAVLFSTLMHGAVIAVLLLLTYVVRRHVSEASPIIELVQGEGDNFAATVAPAAGTPGAIKVDVPEPAKPEPATVAPAPLEAVPAPVTKPVDPASKIAQVVRTIERKDRQNTDKIRADAQKKAKEEARAAPLTKEQFDQQNKGKAPVTTKAVASAKIPKVEGAGILKGVAGGSTANTTGGAGGKALVRENGDELAAYYALFKQRLQLELQPPPGLSDSLVAEVVVTISATGALSGPRIATSSGSPEFDQAVLAAIGRMRMPAHPNGRSESVQFQIRLRDVSNG